MEFVKKCDAWQRHTNLYGFPIKCLRSLSSPWPFNKWGIDILGPLPIGVFQLKYLIVATDYFSKWVKAKLVAIIITERVKKFLWQSILCQFGVPKLNFRQWHIVQLFKCQRICESHEINLIFMLVEHPQSNVQVEVANKVVLNGLKMHLVHV